MAINPAALAQATAPVVAESDFSYEPPAGPDPSEQDAFSQSLKDIVSEIEGEYNSDETPEFTEEELAADETEAPEAETPAEPIEEKDDPAVARGMERLVAREVAIQAREAAIQAKEQRFAALEQELTQLRAQAPQQQLLEDFDHSPTAAVTALGKDPKTVIRLMLAEQLEAEGKEVPAELKEFVREAKYNRRVSQLERQLAQKSKAEQDMMEYRAVDLGAQEHVKTLVGSKDVPTLAKIAASNPARAHQEIMEEIQRDARARMAAEPNGRPISYAEATTRAEKRLAELSGLFVPASTEATKPASAVKKPIPPQQKPPVRPLKPWEKKDDDLYKRGIDEAVREYHLSEAKARRR